MMLGKYFAAALSGLAGLLLTAGVPAHHTSVAFFDGDKTVSVVGTVTGSKLANPHSYFRVTTETGEDWVFESAASYTSMQKEGWDKETIPIGARVRASGAPSRDGKPIARYESILVLGEAGEDAQLYIGGRGAWAARAREVGRPCENGISSCVALDSQAIDTLQEEFGDIL